MFFLLSTVPVLLFGYTQGNRLANEAGSIVDRDALHRATSFSRSIEEMVNTRVQVLRGLEGTLGTPVEWSAQTLQHSFENTAALPGLFSAIYLARIDGFSIVFASNARGDEHSVQEPNVGLNYKDRPYWQELLATRQTALSRVLMGRASDSPHFAIAEPVFNQDGVLEGVIAGGVDLSSIQQVAKEIAGEGDSLRILLLDQHKRVIADSHQLSPQLTDLSSLPLYQDTEADRPEVRTGFNENGDPTRETARSFFLFNKRWTVHAAIPSQNVDRLAFMARQDALAVTLASIFASLLLSALLSWRLTKMVHRAVRITEKLGKENFSQSPALPSRFLPRELVQLTYAARQAIDILRHRQAELAGTLTDLAAANERLIPLAKVWEQAADGLEICNEKGIVLFANPAQYALTNLKPGEVIGRRSKVLVDATEPIRALLKKLSQGERIDLKSSGSNSEETDTFLYEITLYPVFNEQNRFHQIVIVYRDLTEKFATEQALRQSERLAALGTLAAGVAHEINNPLTYIKANLEQQRDQLRQALGALNPQVITTMATLNEENLVGVDRVAEIVKNLLSTARPDTRSETSFQLSPLIESCIRVANNEIRHRAQLVVDLEPRPMFISGNQAQLSQVLVNLLFNSVGAIESGQTKSNTITVSSGLKSENVVYISVSDTGKGIAPEHIERIFDPFFTTKKIGSGTGLGLSICHRIITSMNGEIHVTSELGQGTTFTISLPTTTPPETTVAASALTTLDTPPLDILIVDDLPQIAKVISRMLKQHQTTSVYSSSKALELMTAITYDAIICDVMMPDMTGLELYQEVKRRWPGQEQRFIFVTGGIFSELDSESIIETGRPIVHKPLNKETLLNSVQHVSEAIR
jgi:PAS domain S-box-containing protein